MKAREDLQCKVGGQSMVAPLRRVLVCPPRQAGWLDQRAGQWRELGFLAPPSGTQAEEEYEELLRILDRFGVELLRLDFHPRLTLDAVYVHDASLTTDRGMILLRMGKECRSGEVSHQEELFHRMGIPVLGRLQGEAVAEGGDLVWLDQHTLLAGEGYRTNREGIRQLQHLLAPLQVEVIPAPLPHAAGPQACLHLMSLLSLLDEGRALVDLPWLSVSTVQLLQKRGIELIEIDPRERATLACNVLALGKGNLVALQENRRTNDRLRSLGYQVWTFPGSQIAVNGQGGPTCLTRPLWRAD